MYNRLPGRSKCIAKFPKVRKASKGADFHLVGIPKVSHHRRPWGFPRCLFTDLALGIPKVQRHFQDSWRGCHNVAKNRAIARLRLPKALDKALLGFSKGFERSLGKGKKFLLWSNSNVRPETVSTIQSRSLEAFTDLPGHHFVF